jgi:hypothetical protein
VFETGTTLREARIRRGLDLGQVERDTKIRARYLAALEDDDFDALPEPAYARGFLRTHADYLGLESQRYVDEHHRRFAPPDEASAVAPVRIRRPGPALARWLAAAVIVAAALVALIACQLTSGGTGSRAVRVGRNAEDRPDVHFVSRRLWMRLGAPWNLDARLNGKPTTLAPRTGDIVVTALGPSSPASG